MTDIPHIAGLRDIADRYDGFILDVFGVIHNGLRPFPGTVRCLEHLKSSGKTICLLSNSPRRSDNIVDHCAQMGIASSLFDHVVTSGEATYHAMENHVQEYGRRCYFIGTSFVRHLVDGIDMDITDDPDNADFILNAIPGTEEADVADLLAHLDRALDRGLPMICANPDMVVNIGDQQKKCAGTYARLYEDRGGHVTYYGKPYEPVYETARQLLGQMDKAKICAVGDSLHTDVQGANRFGIDCIFNLVGIHWEEVSLDHAPDKADIEKIKALINSQAHRPTYSMGGFDW